MKKALITGANGFVGKHLRKYLEGKYEVIPTSRTVSSKDGVYKMNLLDYEEVRSTIHRFAPDYIFHLGAIAFVPSSFQDPVLTFDTNLIGTTHLFEAVRSVGIDPTIHVAGSSEEYGMVYKDEVPIDETNPLRPLSPYGVSKCAVDLLGYQYHQSYDMKIVRTRAFNHSGYGRREYYFISSFAKQIAELEKDGGGVLEHGNLKARRDVTDVRDMVRAYQLAVEKCEPGEVYNIGTGISYEIQEILEVLLDQSSAKIVTAQDEKRMRPSDVMILEADSTKFREKTGWEPTYGIEDTCAEALRYWREHES